MFSRVKLGCYILAACSVFVFSINAYTEELTTSDYVTTGGAYLSNNIPVSAMGTIDSAHIKRCFDSFKETRERVSTGSTQTVVILSNGAGIAPYITLQSDAPNGKHYTLWQTLNGEIKGYALRDGEGFDYNDNTIAALPLTWHSTFVWDSLFASKKELKSFSCVLMGRTRVMGKKVSLLRLMPQENLRYSYLIAKDELSGFPVELTILDPKGAVMTRMTTMDSRTITSQNFPITEDIFDGFETRYAQHLKEEAERKGTGQTDNLASAAVKEPKAQSSQLYPWKVLQIPPVYELVSSGVFEQAGPNCVYQEYSDGLTTFRVYRNTSSTMHFPVLTNGTISVVRKKTGKYEYTVVGEVPIALAEYVLTRVNG